MCACAGQWPLSPEEAFFADSIPSVTACSSVVLTASILYYGRSTDYRSALGLEVSATSHVLRPEDKH